MSFESFWEDAKKQVESSIDDLKKTGLPAIQSSLEKWGIDVLQKQNKETQKTLTQNVNEVLSRPSTGTGFSDYLSQSLQGPMFKQYGGVMIAGIVGLVIIGMYLRK